VNFSKDILRSDFPLWLSPMEDVTNPPFRRICKRFGADVLVTEFVPSDAIIRNVAKSLLKFQFSETERPLGIQIYGHLEDAMIEAAKMAAEVKPDFIDINWGCPVKKIANRGAGSGIFKDIPKMIRITENIVNAVNLPVTVKTRLGWDEHSKVIVDVAERLQDTGIAGLSIHGRTRSQLYTGEADWTLIGEVKANPRIHIPIIGNGDVTTPQRAKACFETYGVDAVMIGRGSIGRPWIFEEIKHYLKTGEETPANPFAWYLDILKTQITKNIEWLGERRGITHSRRHLAASPLFKGIDHFKPTRIAMLRAETKDELFGILDGIEGEFEVG
jgi:nifR3 family TIM-barrel protein